MTDEQVLSDGKNLMEVLKRYTTLSTKDARELIEQLGKSESDKFDLDTSGKIFIYNRMYCNVPESVDQKTWKFFGSWFGVPHKDGVVNALYPLALTKEGKLELHFSFGGYAGPPYRGLEEFDFLIKRYGKREQAK